MPCDDLHCSFDKVTRCVELGIDVLVDDSPVNIAKAKEAGIVAATIIHPWNEELVSRDGVIGARDWKQLRRELEPVLAAPANRRRGRTKRTTLSLRDREPAVEALVPAEELKDHLPGIEPERRLNDWGRSERIEEYLRRHPRRVLLPLLVPRRGGGDRERARYGRGLLVSNHSGALPPDAAMIAKAIREEHTHPRPLNITVEHFFKGYPGLHMLIPKIGCVAAHPANVHRLLYDEEQLVLVFPEGRKGTEKLYKDRYRLRRFGRGGFVEAAMRAGAPIVPVCVVGAEEAAPVFAQIGLAQAPDRSSLLPDHADLPPLRPARDARLPAGQVQAALPRADPLRRARDARGQGARPDRGPRGARAYPGRPLGHARRRASRCGSDDAGRLAPHPRSPESRPTGAGGWRRRSRRFPRDRGDRSAWTTRSRRSSWSAPST